MTETRGKSHKEEEIRSTFNDQNICSADKDTSFAIHQYHPENLLHKYCSERKLTIYKIHEILTGHQQKKKKRKRKDKHQDHCHKEIWQQETNTMQKPFFTKA